MTSPPPSTRNHAAFLARLEAIVGRNQVLTSPKSTHRYRTGFRFGGGPALAVVLPGSLVEQWRVFKECVAAGKIVIMQAANTGLTGGSTPDGDDYDRDIVVISTLRMAKLHLIADGKQVVVLCPTTLLAEQTERQGHLVALGQLCRRLAVAISQAGEGSDPADMPRYPAFRGASAGS